MLHHFGQETLLDDLTQAVKALPRRERVLIPPLLSNALSLCQSVSLPLAGAQHCNADQPIRLTAMPSMLVRHKDLSVSISDRLRRVTA